MESKSVRSLPESIWSLLGSKEDFTANWAESVCNIIGDLPIMKQPGCVSDKMELTDRADEDRDAPVLKIRGELSSLGDYLSHLNLQRREALNAYLDLKGNIRVFCRVRCFLPGEGCYHSKSIVTADLDNVLLKISENKSKEYSFDKVFHQHSTQDEIFSEIEPVIKSALDGYNVCIFAYGQTGTGKTYTMEGTPESPGVVPRGIEALFRQAVESNCKFLFTFSMLEIYMGHLRDLLVPHNKNPRVAKPPSLSIQMDPNGGIEIENLVAVKVSSLEKVKGLYKRGSRLRTTASTLSNSTSSRSHCLIRISMTYPGALERRRETNKIWMVDLGGSERLLKTQATGRRLEEGKAINLSLSALGYVISALQSKNHHVPYRNSKLTQVLRDSLGSDSKTIMLTHVSPKQEDMCETLCSLEFASRVKHIHLGNEEPTELRVEKQGILAELLQKVKHIESERQDVKRKIDRLHGKLKNLARPETLNERQLECSVQSTESLHSSGTKSMKSLRGYTGTTTSLPRFMRPTVSSKKKTGVDRQTSGTKWKKPPVPSKNRKSTSVYDESEVASTMNRLWRSDHGSECSISTRSYSHWKESTDDGSECSQIRSEYETKKIIFIEEAKDPRNLQTTYIESADKTEFSVVEKADQKKHTIGKRRHIQMSTKTTTTNIHQIKRVLALPIDKAGDKSKEQNRDTLTRKAGARNPGKGNKELTKYFSKKEANGTVKETRSIKKSNMNETVDESHSFLATLAYTVSEPDQNTDLDQTSQKTELLPIQHKELTEITEAVEADGDLSTVRSETHAYNSDTISDKSFTEEISRSQQQKKEVDRTFLCSMRSRRTLFQEKDLPELQQQIAAVGEPEPSVTNDQQENYNAGTCRVLRQTIQIVWAIALFWLGIHSLGFSDDFFHGVIL